MKVTLTLLSSWAGLAREKGGLRCAGTSIICEGPKPKQLATSHSNCRATDSAFNGMGVVRACVHLLEDMNRADR